MSSKREKLDKLDFTEFLSCLIKIAIKCYPSCSDKQAAMQQLLMDNILPMAQRREPKEIFSILKLQSVEALIKYYEDALFSLFKFYAATSDQNIKEKNLIQATSKNVRTFDEHKELIQLAKEKCNIQSSESRQMGYSDFLRFANDFGIVSRYLYKYLILDCFFGDLSYHCA